ncbi:MAG: molybdenum cofactor biosynthesis enzyme [Eggerthellaceae bacterium]|nr:molybdenum cofactor biosynthesis enzyme [Eggerthellaceae bacterium]
MRIGACNGSLFRDERGFTTTSMVLSLLITLALVFTAAQVYRINSASAEVQDVADAAALAAENQVAEFMLIVRFCDAVVLSLTLTAATATGLGLAALCTPATASLSEGLLSVGQNLFKARDGFSDRATSALNKLQEALPFFAAACAAGVAQANDVDSSGAHYLGVAVLMPEKGKAIEIADDDEAEQLLDEIDEQADDIRAKAKEAEEAAEEANRAKERAFMRDCGDNPSYCMYERAAHLAGLSGPENPLYSSVDTWSFQVALSRAKAYYRMRLGNESPADGSLDEQARSALRTRYYRYVVEELGGAYVHETADSFDANIPHVPSNTAEMRLTSLYTDAVYPITAAESGASVMHAWAGCPAAAGSLGLGSIQDMEAGGFETCPICGFTAASMGKVAAASSSIENGFEFHYEAVADEAAVYQEARHRADQPKSEVKSRVGGLFEKLVEVLKSTADKRIDASPPGRYGAIAFVVNAGTTSTAGGFASGFVSGGTLGPRAAVSAATLVDEGSDEGKTALNSALDGLRESGGAAVGAVGIVLDAWSWLLVAYADGQDALTSAIRHGLDSLPLVGASGLGTWASDKLNSVIGDVGLQPAKIGALKPVIVNSAHVAAKGEGSFASGYVSVKQRIVAHPLMSADLFSSLLTEAERMALEKVDGLGDSIEIASIEIAGDGGPSIPITIPLPDAVKFQGVSAIEGLFDQLRSFYVETTGVRVWE